MAQVVANRGNKLHAPENTRAALLSAYTAGADILEFGVRLTKDGHPVVSSVEDLEELTGVQGTISNTNLADLRKLDFGANFSVRNSTAHPWQREKPEAHIETLGGLLDLLPESATKLIQAYPSEGANAADLADKTIKALKARGLVSSTILCSADADVLGAASSLESNLRTALCIDDPGASPNSLQDWLAQEPHAVVLPLSAVLTEEQQLKPLGAELREAHNSGALPLGVVLRPEGGDGTFTQEQYAALAGYSFVYAISTTSMLNVMNFVRRYRQLEKASFAGKEEEPGRFPFGYAKANRFAHVYQDDGVHIKLSPYQGPPPIVSEPTGDPVQDRLTRLEEASWNAARDWPFYSGGGVGTKFGLDGDFVAEVDFSSTTTSQATMLEMAVINVDPAKHRPGWKKNSSGKLVPNPPQSFRDKDSFFDPHGAPPFVGVEHDEDDGYRINWNLGTEYDNNQYGRPLGDGTTKQGRMRLERRGPYFSAYYKDEQNSDWVCVGACRNDSMNYRVYLRCVGKRWRQEDDRPEATEPYYPIPENHIIFKNFLVLIPLKE
jgi:glycerophosphoryl diester phosphodiesterase